MLAKNKVTFGKKNHNKKTKNNICRWKKPRQLTKQPK